MADGQVVPVTRLLDERGLSPFQVKLIFWSLFVVLIDGYDIGAISFAAPYLVGAWKIPRESLGGLLGASLIGMLPGSLVFGWVGDRHGRRAALITSMLWFGVFTFVAAYATGYDEMFWLRLIAGVGIGGIIPNIVAVNTESAPRHLRRTLAIIAIGLVPVGGAIPGLVSVWLVPSYGWQILFLIGGVAPIVIAIACFLGFPESIKFMAIHPGQRANMVRALKAIRPDFVVPQGARFIVEDEKQVPGFNPTYLFGQGLHVITPLLWLLFCLNLMGFFFIASWTPTLLVAAHLSPALSAWTGAWLQIGGTVGALVLCRWLDKGGFLAITVLFVAAVPVVGSIGYLAVSSETAVKIAAFLAGVCVLGIQTGINVQGAMVYPTSLRANGSGWELGLGRIGSIVGPFLGGLAAGAPIERLYTWAAVPFALGAVVCFTIHRLNTARLRVEAPLATERPQPAE